MGVLMHLSRASGAMDNASDYGSEDSRFDSWLARSFSFSGILNNCYDCRFVPHNNNNNNNNKKPRFTTSCSLINCKSVEECALGKHKILHLFGLFMDVFCTGEDYYSRIQNILLLLFLFNSYLQIIVPIKILHTEKLMISVQYVKKTNKMSSTWTS